MRKRLGGTGHDLSHHLEARPHERYRGGKGDERRERERCVRRAQEGERRDGPRKVHKRFGNVVGQEQLEALDVVEQHRLDLPDRPLSQGPKRRVRQMVDDPAPHVEKRSVSALVRQQARGGEACVLHDESNRHYDGAPHEQPFGQGPRIRRPHDLENAPVRDHGHKARCRRRDHRRDQKLPIGARPCEHERERPARLLLLCHTASLFACLHLFVSVTNGRIRSRSFKARITIPLSSSAYEACIRLLGARLRPIIALAIDE